MSSDQEGDFSLLTPEILVDLREEAIREALGHQDIQFKAALLSFAHSICHIELICLNAQRKKDSS